MEVVVEDGAERTTAPWLLDGLPELDVSTADSPVGSLVAVELPDVGTPSRL